MDLQPLTLLSPSPTHSYTYLTSGYPSLPPTPSILSRQSSTTRLRPSAQRTAVPTSTSTPSLQQPRRNRPPNRRAVTGAAALQPPRSSPAAPLALSRNPSSSSRRTRAAVRNSTSNAPEDDWLTRTASALTLAHMEEKGVSWLAQRESSTSLMSADAAAAADADATAAGDEGEADDEFETAASTPAWGIGASGSAARSRVQSRRASLGRGNLVGDSSSGLGVAEEEGSLGDVRPDFVDLAEGDDFEGEEDEEEEMLDEGEMRKLVMGRVGGWVDWAVGWMDFRGEREGEGEGEGEGGEDAEAEGGGNEKEARGEETIQVPRRRVGGLDIEEVQRRLRRREKEVEEADAAQDNARVIEMPPQGESAGAINDARWLFGIAKNMIL